MLAVTRLSQKFLDGITEICGSEGLLTGDDVSLRAVDWRGRPVPKPGAIARPASVEEVSELLRHCHANDVPVVAVGGLTGTVHATDSALDQLQISTERMNAIEAVDPIGGTMTVQAGVPLQIVQESAQENGFMFGVDLGARGTATIGGCIATNAGGNQVLRFGMMRDQVLGLEVVLADGTIVSSLNRLLKNNAGYDLKHMFVGSEGTLGFITRAVLRLRPQPEHRATALLAFSDFQSLTQTFQTLRTALNSDLVAFEVMWQEHFQIVAIQSGKHPSSLSGDYAFYAVVEYAGSAAENETTQFESVLGNAIEQELIADAIIAQSQTQQQQIWAIREDLESLTHALKASLDFDVGLPIEYMEEYTETVHANILRKFGPTARSVFFGHLGDGNLHIMISVPPDTENARHRIEETVYPPLSAFGGTVSAEHGIGLEKKPWLQVCRSPQEIALMGTLKTALDPKGLLNPGKIF